MFKSTRILRLGLAMALCMAQTAQAEILITPLDVSNPAGQGVQIVPESQGGAGTQAQNQPGPQEKPGAGSPLRQGTRAPSPAPQAPRREIRTPSPAPQAPRQGL